MPFAVVPAATRDITRPEAKYRLTLMFCFTGALRPHQDSYVHRHSPGTAKIAKIADREGLRTFTLDFPPGFCTDLAVGASVSTDGVCLTVTELTGPDQATTSCCKAWPSPRWAPIRKATAPVERAARTAPRSVGIRCRGMWTSSEVVMVKSSDTNRLMRFSIPEDFRKYVFAKGYIAINGASLTVSEVNRAEGWFEVWLIPETRRMTVFEDKQVGDAVNIEIERGTQVVVDTVRETVQESLGKLQPLLEAILKERDCRWRTS